MSRKQSAYLDDLLSDDDAGAPAPAPAPTIRPRSSTLLSRATTLDRLASGEVRQVTELKLDPARCRIWPGNARLYAHLSEEGCRDLIDSMIAEGGQRVPAIVRRLKDDPDHDYEVIAGSRRHWSVSWLRTHSYPDISFIAHVHDLDDEAAFRLADLENRARKDISDLERARNYAAALADHYGGVQARMAERLRVSKGWLSKMLKVASLPDAVVAAFASPADIQMKPAYPLAQALDDRATAKLILAEAARVASEQADLRKHGRPALPAAAVIKRLIDFGYSRQSPPALYEEVSKLGRPVATVLSANRQGITIRLHSGSGVSDEEAVEAVRNALSHLGRTGKGLQR